MINKIHNMLSSQYVKSIIHLTMGSAFAQMITIIVSPISTRLYTPEELGVYTLILTIISMFGPVLCGKYDLAIVLAKDEKEVKALIIASTFFSFVFLSVVMLLFDLYMENYLQISTENCYLLFGILTITIINNILISYNNRYKEYKIISSTYIVGSVIQNIGLIVFGLLKLGSVGLIIAQLLSLAFAVLNQFRHLYQNGLQFKGVRTQGIIDVLSKYKKQPLFSMPAHFINTSSYSMLNFFISSLFGIGTFGYYSMSYRILGLPLNIISMNVSKVFFQRATEEKQKYGNYNKTLKQMSILLTCISIPMATILILFAPYFFEIIFGQGWAESGTYVRILAPMFGLRLIVSALTPALIISDRQKLELLMQSLFIISSISSYFISITLGYQITAFLTLISITYSVIYIIFYFIIYRLSS